MRLIDADKLEAELHERLCNPRNPGQSAGIAAAIHLVQKQPTVCGEETKNERLVVTDAFGCYEIDLEDVLPI